MKLQWKVTRGHMMEARLPKVYSQTKKRLAEELERIVETALVGSLKAQVAIGRRDRSQDTLVCSFHNFDIQGAVRHTVVR